MTAPIVRVCVGVIILNTAGHILFGQRCNVHGQGTWAIIGGHLEYGEDFATCARRETLE